MRTITKAVLADKPLRLTLDEYLTNGHWAVRAATVKPHAFEVQPMTTAIVPTVAAVVNPATMQRWRPLTIVLTTVGWAPVRLMVSEDGQLAGLNETYAKWLDLPDQLYASKPMVPGSRDLAPGALWTATGDALLMPMVVKADTIAPLTLSRKQARALFPDIPEGRFAAPPAPALEAETAR